MDYMGGASEITRFLIRREHYRRTGEREGNRGEEGKGRRYFENVTLLAFNMEKEDMSQGMNQFPEPG